MAKREKKRKSKRRFPGMAGYILRHDDPIVDIFLFYCSACPPWIKKS